MNQHITSISDKCIALIKGFEVFYGTAYLCPAKVWTIGWGTTVYPDGTRVKKGDRITEARAAECFRHDSLGCARDVDAITRDDISQNQFDALVSFTYNEGQPNLRSSTLLKLINAGDFNAQRISKAFAMYNKARQGGKLVPLAGLTRRRKSEANLFLTGNLNFFE